ncbi:hypothetical protein BCR32DRAFT_275526 [Anaeromyces robustus]|uniref:Uncharacterized protein n=1 Tax=Anaeromyces robustus TaxID=1754192 RepID=A0A1Y1XKJ3_9FUNG|nr:hypothetical protein BCR32DRAFT_275526 [Anaeromyces robustus]|eukprot:ORX86280.1 hypothetical protein BCR32DRAFT_275526 [Anaeromyces robustus]
MEEPNDNNSFIEKNYLKDLFKRNNVKRTSEVQCYYYYENNECFKDDSIFKNSLESWYKECTPLVNSDNDNNIEFNTKRIVYKSSNKSQYYFRCLYELCFFVFPKFGFN